MLLVLLLVRVSFAPTVSCFVLIKYYLSRTQVRMRRVSISSGFSKLWCVCFFLRSFAICLFVCLFFFVRFEKCRKERKEGRKAPPPPPVQPHTKKPPLVKKRWYSSSSVALARSAAFERARTFGLLSRATRSWRGTRGTPRDTPSKNSRRYDPCLFVALSSSSFCVETTHHPSIDRCRLALLDTARVRA